MDTEKLIPYLVVAGMAAGIWLLGSMITYPPYARLGAFTFLVLGLSSLALSRHDFEEESEEGLEGDAGKSPEPGGKSLGKQKAKPKQGKSKQPPIPKA